jgi:hypothetical protein
MLKLVMTEGLMSIPEIRIGFLGHPINSGIFWFQQIFD